MMLWILYRRARHALWRLRYQRGKPERAGCGWFEIPAADER